MNGNFKPFQWRRWVWFIEAQICGFKQLTKYTIAPKSFSTEPSLFSTDPSLDKYRIVEQWQSCLYLRKIFIHLTSQQNDNSKGATSTSPMLHDLSADSNARFGQDSLFAPCPVECQVIKNTYLYWSQDDSKLSLRYQVSSCLDRFFSLDVAWRSET